MVHAEVLQDTSTTDIQTNTKKTINPTGTMHRDYRGQTNNGSGAAL